MNIATLSEDGFDADQWIGNACATASGRRLVVTYAPRTFTNKSALFSRGAFTATVDLSDGSVRKLPVLSTLAYYSPGCGVGETAVITQAGDDELAGTRLFTVEAAEAKVGPPMKVSGQVTSAIPVSGAIVAADVNRVVRFESAGKRSVLAQAGQIPFRITAAGDGVAYLEGVGDEALVQYLSAGQVADASVSRPMTLARGKLTGVDLTRANGRAYVTGQATGQAGQSGVGILAVAKGSRISTLAEAAVTSTRWAGSADPRVGPASAVGPDGARAVDVGLRHLRTGKDTHSIVVAGSVAGGRVAAHPGLAPRQQQPSPRAAVAGAGSPTDPVEVERTCSVPRNDVGNQVMQPKPRQVEWAVDQAVRGVLNVARGENWKSLGMPAYTPQGLFPRGDLSGGGYVPAQVMLGIAAQESNLWQATGRALPGVTANPLIGNFYGRQIYNHDPYDDWNIDWDEADCGYGVMQITDGMRLPGRERPGETALPHQTQRAVALDFAANIAAGLQILQDKWKQTREAGMYVNSGDPRYLENWFFAIWAYNSGFHPNKGDGSPWGVGWHNNPANPHYPANRAAFLDTTMADAAHPQDWPYQEKVLGFAGHPIELPEAPNTYVAAFRPAQWNGGAVNGPINRTKVKPPTNLFCDSTNDCVPGAAYPPDAPEVRDEPPGPCAHRNSSGQYDLKCWYHRPVIWKPDCSATCGFELLRFDPGYAYQADGTSYLPRCNLDGLPSNAMIIDDVPDGRPSIRPDCNRGWLNAGSFTLDFADDSAGNFPSKVDFHQFGAGFGGHFYSSFTRGPHHWNEADLKVTGTWRLTNPRYGWTRVKVFIPDTGAWTRQAKYVINLGDGRSRFRVVNQAWQAHTWVDLGVFNLNGQASVTLSTYAEDGVGTHQIIWDAVAFIPTTQPVAQYVALGDSYSSGEGLGPYLLNSDFKRADNSDANTCHRSVNNAYPSLVKVAGQTQTIAQQAANGTASFGFIACSGALTTNVTRAAYNDPPKQHDLDGHTDWGKPDNQWGWGTYYQHGELPQVEQGWLDEETTLVTLTIGGNDARFAEVLRTCITSVLDSCFASTHHLTRGNGVVDPDYLQRYEKLLIREMLPEHLLAVYRAVVSQAPNAKVLVLGYPQLFNDRFATAPQDCIGLSALEMRGLNTLADLLNLKIARAVQQVHDEGHDISFINTTQRWRDTHSHWACEFFTDPWIRGGIISCDSNVGTQTPCPASFHPTVTGQAALADIVSTQLRGTSPVAAVKQRVIDYAASRAPDPRWNLTPAQAQAIAQRCLDLTRIGGTIGDPCMHEPIFVVSSADSGDAAVNDDQALAQKLPWWVRLNYTSSVLREQYIAPRDWYNYRDYQPNYCSATTRPNGFQCDEFPYFSSELGAAFDYFDGYYAEGSTKLLWVDEPLNKNEGNTLSAMYGRCQIPSSMYGSDSTLISLGGPYLVIPVTTGALPNTHYIC